MYSLFDIVILQVTVRDASGVVQETVHLGDPLGSSSSRLSLLMDNNHFYEAEPADGEYCLVAIMAASGKRDHVVCMVRYEDTPHSITCDLNRKITRTKFFY